MGPFKRLVTLIFLFICPLNVFAQSSGAQRAEEDLPLRDPRIGTKAVPRAMRFSGTLRADDGTPRTGVAALTFSLYKEAQGESSVWLETHNVTLDEQGRYSVLLGSTGEGLPVSLFAAGDARWLGVRVAEEGATEQPRVMLVSVPYALASGDAQSLGGRPVKDFALTRAAVLASGDAAAGGETSGTVMSTTNTVNRIAKFTALDTLGDSLIYDSGSNIGIGTTSPTALLHVNATAGDAFNLYTSTTAGGSVAVYANHFGAASIGYAGFFSKTGAGGTNIGLYAEASGGSQNYAALFQGGNVGIGTNVPVAKLQVNATNQDAINIYSTATGGGTVALYADHSGASPLGYAGFFSKTGAGGTNIGLYATATGATNNYAGIFQGGNVGIGTGAPSQRLEVAGTIYSSTGGFRFPDSTTQTTATTTSNFQARVTGTCATNNYVRVINQDGTVTCGADQTGAGGIVYPYSSGNQSTTSGAFTVTQTNSIVLAGDPTFTFASTSIPAAIVGYASPTAGNTAVGIVGFSNNVNSPALVGWNGATGTIGQSTDAQGVIGQSDAIGGTGVEGTARASTGTGAGVKGQANSPNGVGVYGQNSTPGGLAGKFDGAVEVQGNLKVSSPISTPGGGAVAVSGGLNVQSGGITVTGNSSIQGTLSVSGTVNKNGGNFRIDHPLDPAGKYLYHSFVESPDMMNIYNGVITLDANGQAWVTMPDWFEALNMDFRYQLTAIGRPAPNLYIAKEMKGNRFKIAGGIAKTKVSWQVTGVRHDVWANDNRTVVEVVKPANEQGTYVYPEGFRKVVAKK